MPKGENGFHARAEGGDFDIHCGGIAMTIDWRRFRALTFDCYGTLIDWESGILSVLRPWAAKQGIRSDDEALLADFAAVESCIQTAPPALLYPRVLAETLKALGVKHGVAVGEEEARGAGA